LHTYSTIGLLFSVDIRSFTRFFITESNTSTSTTHRHLTNRLISRLRSDPAMMPSEWSKEYCLTCEAEAPHGAVYCSQACRLAEMPTGSCSSSPKTAPSSSSSAALGGFYLPPALNFSTLSSKSSMLPSTIPSPTTRSYPTWSHTSVRKNSSPYGLHPSPSHTSLSSVPSQHSQFETAYLSEKSLRELNDYANCFDQVRDTKRRMTVI